MSEDYGAKITIPGKEFTSQDYKDFNLWSKHPTPKTYIVDTYIYTFPSNLDAVTIQINHNLGTNRVVLLSTEGPNAEWKNSGGGFNWFYDSGGNFAYFNWDIRSRTNDIQIRYWITNKIGSGRPTAGETWIFRYAIFIEEVEST